MRKTVEELLLLEVVVLDAEDAERERDVGAGLQNSKSNLCGKYFHK